MRPVQVVTHQKEDAVETNDDREVMVEKGKIRPELLVRTRNPKNEVAQINLLCIDSTAQAWSALYI